MKRKDETAFTSSYQNGKGSAVRNHIVGQIYHPALAWNRAILTGHRQMHLNTVRLGTGMPSLR